MDLDSITALEQLYVEAGDPSLGKAYDALLERFDGGQRDRETCLRLMFLAWYSCSEPEFLTGLPYSDPEGQHGRVFRATFEQLGARSSKDPEVIFTASLMTSMFPYCCGPEPEWSAIGEELKARLAALPVASRPSATSFTGRGAYGHYFAHMARPVRRSEALMPVLLPLWG